MMFDTAAGVQIEPLLLQNYFDTLVNHFFKILPIRESEEASLVTYMYSLRSELLGCQEFVCAVKYDAMYLTLISILQYLIDHPESSVKDVKREVFRAIRICNQLKDRYSDCEVRQ